jgi:hypothetical protein
MTRPIFIVKANVTSKLAFGRTQDVGTLSDLLESGVQQNGKGEGAHGRVSLLRYLMSYTTRHLMALKTTKVNMVLSSKVIVNQSELCVG